MVRVQFFKYILTLSISCIDYTSGNATRPYGCDVVSQPWLGTIPLPGPGVTLVTLTTDTNRRHHSASMCCVVAAQFEISDDFMSNFDLVFIKLPGVNVFSNIIRHKTLVGFQLKCYSCKTSYHFRLWSIARLLSHAFWPREPMICMIRSLFGAMIIALFTVINVSLGGIDRRQNLCDTPSPHIQSLTRIYGIAK